MSEKQTYLLDRLRDFKIGKYFRELSVVIIGIFVTLFFTDRLNDASKQREIKESAYFIRMELASNLEQLESAEKMYLRDREILRLLRDNMDNVKAIPFDSLEMHINTLGQIYPLIISTNALEVFKVSGLMPYIKEKAFLLELFQVYYSLEGMKYALDFFLDMKRSSHLDMDSETTALQYEYAAKKEMHAYFELLLKSDKSRLFILNGLGAISATSFTEVKKLMEQMIERIDNEYLK